MDDVVRLMTSLKTRRAVFAERLAANKKHVDSSKILDKKKKGHCGASFKWHLGEQKTHAHI